MYHYGGEESTGGWAHNNWTCELGDNGHMGTFSTFQFYCEMKTALKNKDHQFNKKKKKKKLC